MGPRVTAATADTELPELHFSNAGQPMHAASFLNPKNHSKQLMMIRRATQADFDAMWPIFRTVVSTGTTYVFAATTDHQTGFAYWFGDGIVTYVAEAGGRIVGMYKLVANQRDRGSHVANASFMVDPACSGLGLGKVMGLHCISEARKAGYSAVQFNFVVSTNDRAVALWKNLGFAIVGTIPKAFLHQEFGLVDAYVMHRFLDEDHS